MKLTGDDREMLRVYAVAVMHIYDRDMADDLVQDAMLRAHMAILKGKYEETGNRRGWLIQIMRNCFASWWKQKKLRHAKLGRAELWWKQSTTTGCYQTHTDSGYEPEIQQFMEEIPPMMADILRLRAEDMSYEEISKELDIPIGTVMSRMSRARGHFIRVSGMESIQDYWNRFPQVEEEYYEKWLTCKPKAKFSST